MTATPEQQSLATVWLWLAKPHLGPEQLLMVLTDHPEQGTVYRPLLFVDKATADSQADLAVEAAASLGVGAVLREFRAAPVEDVTP